MVILTALEIKKWDEFTILHEPVDSFELMQRASKIFVNWLMQTAAPDRDIVLFCGVGNNGGDGLVIASILLLYKYEIKLWICEISATKSADFIKALDYFKSCGGEYEVLKPGDPFVVIPANSIVVDAVLGTGLNKPAEGYWGSFFSYLNSSGAEIISVDIPSGMFADRHTSSVSVHADKVFTFEGAKLGFLVP